jgi:hypothetical protein
MIKLLRLVIVQLSFSILVTSVSMAQMPESTARTWTSFSFEQTGLKEILIVTPRPYAPAQVAQAEGKITELHNAVRQGASFQEVATANSEGPTADAGGLLGRFERRELARPFAEFAFQAKVGDVSEVMRAKQGFLFLKLTDWDRIDLTLDLPEAFLNRQKLQPYLWRYIKEAEFQCWKTVLSHLQSVNQKTEGEIAIGFRILRDGSIAQLDTFSRTGDVATDEALIEALLHSVPLQPLDGVTSDAYLPVRLRFAYNGDTTP